MGGREWWVFVCEGGASSLLTLSHRRPLSGNVVADW